MSNQTAIKQALAIVDAQHYAGAAQRVAVEAEGYLGLVGRGAQGWEAADMLRRLADTRSDCIPGSLWRGLNRAADLAASVR